MKNITKVLFSTFLFLSMLSVAGFANASSSSLIVQPASSTINVGQSITASVTALSAGNKICAVEGTLTFTNLTCQSITVASSVNAQTTPTCTNPYFLVGVPNCSSADINLFTVTAKTIAKGTATLGVTGVDVVGEGVSVGSTASSGNYTVNEVIVQKPVEEIPTQTETIQQATQKPAAITTTTAADNKEQTNSETNLNTEDTAIQSTEQQTVVQEIIPESAGTASLVSTIGNLFKSPIVWTVIVVIIILIALWIAERRKSKNNQQIK